jgi:hypothetical protein
VNTKKGYLFDGHLEVIAKGSGSNIDLHFDHDSPIDAETALEFLAFEGKKYIYQNTDIFAPLCSH